MFAHSEKLISYFLGLIGTLLLSVENDYLFMNSPPVFVSFFDL